MRIRQFLRKRLHVSLELRDPEPQILTLGLQAASEEHVPTVGGWFSANFGIGNLLAVLGVLGTLIGVYVSLQTRDAEERTQITEAVRRIDSINDRVRTDFVRKDDFASVNAANDARFRNLEAGQTQVVGHLLAGSK